jgi:hypothetical protein
MKVFHLALAGTFVLVASASVVPASTIFLAHYDGNTGSSGLDADYAAGSSTVVSGAGGSISSTAKFGAGSLAPSSAGLVSYSTVGSYNVSSGTIEMFFNTSAWHDGSYHGLFDAYTAGNQDIRIQEGTDGRITAYQTSAGSGGGTWSLTSGNVNSAVTNNTWHHLAWEWNSTNNTSALYLDGAIIDSTVTGTVGYTGAVPTTFNVGYLNAKSLNFNGLIDEFRISDTDIYGGKAFTPPTAPFAVPEPASVAFLAFGALALRRRRA